MRTMRLPAGLTRLLWIGLFGFTCCAAEAADGDSAFFAWRGFHGEYFWGYDKFDQRDQAITRETVTGLEIGQPLFFTNRLSLNLGLGVDFWRPRSENNYASRLIRVEPSIDHAYLRYENAISGWMYSLTGGDFPFAVNSEPAVFGDYLLRYGAYPGYVERSPPAWRTMENRSVPLTGFNLELKSPSGAFRHQFLGIMDSSASGQGKDFSLAYLLKLSANENIEFGFGLEWLRFASTDPKETTPRNPYNAYVKTKSGYILLQYDTTGTVVGDTGYFTRTATQIMASTAFNLQGIFGWQSWDKKDWRVYGEAALLGIANQPIYYDDRLRRLAFMTGVNLPSFGWLDRFVIEAEWHQAHYANIDLLRSNFGPSRLPNPPDADPPEYWKESVFISKSIFPWLFIQGQYVHYPVTAVYEYSHTGQSEPTYFSKTLLLDRFQLRLQGYF